MFGMSKAEKAEKAEYHRRADEYSKEAENEAKKVAKYRKSLESGKSDDPAADRYMIRQHDSARRIAEANARDCRNNAG